MQLLGFIFFLAAFLLSISVVAYAVIANSSRILETLLGKMQEPEVNPPAQIYHLPVHHPIRLEWREAA